MSSLQHDEYETRHSKWAEPIRQPNEVEKRKLVIHALRIMIQFVMENHTYRFNGQIRKQTKGGPIGLDLTGSIAQVFMIWWDKEFIKRITELQIELDMDTRYVDDIDVALPPVANGSRYINENIVVTSEGITEDQDRCSDEITMRLLQCVGNSIHPSIQLEIDYPSRHVDKKMPTIDVKIWVEKMNNQSRILYEHYAKPMSTKAVIYARSAMAWRTKRTVLTQEALRVILNCCRELPWEVVTKHLDHFTARMQYSGYDQQFRLEVIDSALKAYEKLCQAESDGERPLYRPKTWKKKEREEARKQKRLNWYKKGGSKSVMFVPYTLNSQLQNLYMEEVKRSQLPIRVVEKAGTALKQKLQRSDPFASKNCMRQEFFICSSGGTGSC